MAYVNVPMDLAKVKNKVAFNLTMRQIVCIGAGAAVGLPFYFLTRNIIGTGNAATGMVILMVPEFLFAMYEKDGLHFEQILMNIIKVRFLRPAVRRYEAVSFYSAETVRADTKKKTGRKKKGGNSRAKKPKRQG
ncbi:MAG: PrgI family protein [Lachnospiraceae bacterium]|nr:PrgI family protein [Lachnospiraceae bacterium]